MPRALRSYAVLVALSLAPLVAGAEPQIHGAVTAGTGYRTTAPFDEPGMAPAFVQIEAGFLLDPIQKFSPGLSLAVPISPDGTFALMPSALLFRRPNLAYAYYARLGWQIVFAPGSGDRTTDIANGVEVGLGFVWYVRAGLGLVLEADLDYAAGVDDALVIGGQGGVAVGYEILP